MQLELVPNRSFFEVPDNDICLEAHEGALTAGNVLAVGGHPNDGDLVIVTAQKGLLAGWNVPDNDGGAQRVDQMLVVWMQDESVASGAYIESLGTRVADDGVDLNVLVHPEVILSN